MFFLRPFFYYSDIIDHLSIPSCIILVYLEAGSYVKTALDFNLDHSDNGAHNSSEYKITGLGVLSGEKYIYQANTKYDYKCIKSDGDSLKMLHFWINYSEENSPQKTLMLSGITVVEPPFNSFAIHGNEDKALKVDISYYKQVGGWYYQTDGLELYKNSTAKHCFFHSNDDVLKLYHSNVTVEDIVIWKDHNGPVIQWGWGPRNIENVFVNNIYIIHNRMHWPESTHNYCIINSAKSYSDEPRRIKCNEHVKNIHLKNIRAEGMNLCAMRLYPLSSWKQIYIENLYVEQWNKQDISKQQSNLSKEGYEGKNPKRDGYKNKLRGWMEEKCHLEEEQSEITVELELKNYQVGQEQIKKDSDNWKSSQPGRLNFDGELYNKWTCD